MRFRYEGRFKEGPPKVGTVEAENLLDAIDKVSAFPLTEAHLWEDATSLTIKAVPTVEIERGVLMDLVGYLDVGFADDSPPELEEALNKAKEALK